MHHHRLTRAAALSLALAALAAPTAAAQQDLRNPDNRVAAAAPTQDLRSPDARDAADGVGTFSAPEVTIVRLPPSAPAPEPHDGMNWGDAGIGAAGLLSLILLVAAGATAVTRHRRGTRSRMATTG